MKLPASLFFLLALLSAVAQADDQVRRVQEELRKRNLYFGEVDGRKTAEITAAIRRYQTRKGFAGNGELTTDTLRSLDISSPGKPGEEWPEGPVLKSDGAREVAESDRKRLEELAEKALDVVAEGPMATVATVPELLPATLTASDFAAQARKFVSDYLAACETNRLESELKFYADPLLYFDHGKVDRAFVARDVQRFYQRWPERHYELLDFKLGKVEGDEREVIFRIAFKYKGPDRAVSGRSVNRFKIRQEPDGFHFADLKEQRSRE